MFIYLSDVEEGGETAFPLAKVASGVILRILMDRSLLMSSDRLSVIGLRVRRLR